MINHKDIPQTRSIYITRDEFNKELQKLRNTLINEVSILRDENQALRNRISALEGRVVSLN